MKKIYSKDECAPDALDALKWLAKKLGRDADFLDFGNEHIKVNKSDSTLFFFCAKGCYYRLENIFGVYEDLYEISLEEMIEELSGSAIEFCILNRCLKRFGDIEIRDGLAFRGNDPIQFEKMLDVVEGHPDLWRSEPILAQIEGDTVYVEVLMRLLRFGTVCVGLRLVQ